MTLTVIFPATLDIVRYIWKCGYLYNKKMQKIVDFTINRLQNLLTKNKKKW